MNIVKAVEGDLGIQQINGASKMAFIIDGALKRQIVFRPLDNLGIQEIKGSSKMAFIIDGALKRQIVFKPI